MESSFWPLALPSVSTVGTQLDRLAYRAQQWGLRVPLATLRLMTLALSPHAGEDGPDGRARSAFERRYQELLDRDLANVEAGLYPRALLFQMPIATYAWRLPRLLADLPSIVQRVWRRDYKDLPEISMQQIEHFFRHYKDLEPGKWVKIDHWGDADEARALITQALERNGKTKA